MDKEAADKLNERGDGKICPGIFLFKNGLVLIGLRNYTADKYREISVWTTPGGRSEIGESVGDALRRETAEETGISDLTIDGFVGSDPGAKPGDIFYGFIGRTESEPALMEPKKFSEWRWAKTDEIPENFINQPALDRLKKYLSQR